MTRKRSTSKRLNRHIVCIVSNPRFIQLLITIFSGLAIIPSSIIYFNFEMLSREALANSTIQIASINIAIITMILNIIVRLGSSDSLKRSELEKSNKLELNRLENLIFTIVIIEVLFNILAVYFIYLHFLPGFSPLLWAWAVYFILISLFLYLPLIITILRQILEQRGICVANGVTS